MAPAADSDSSKRKNAFEDGSSPNKRQGLFVSPEPNKDELSAIDEVVYDGSKEPFPLRPAYDRGLYDLFKKNRNLVKHLLKILDRHGNVSKELQNMLSKAREAAHSPIPDRITVALVGSTGDGKSSVVARLADEPGLTEQLSDGDSCTSVPMLYMHKLPWQTDKYAAEIQYYTIPKCRQLLEEMLRKYNFYNFQRDLDWTAKQRSEYEQQADTALKTFRTLFRDQDEFGSEGAAQQHLSRRYDSSTTSDLVNTMVGWCEAFFEDLAKENGAGYTRCQGNTIQNLRNQIEPLTAPDHFADEPSFWPLVEKVCVGIPSSRVFQYITIVDLAGITDTNKLRVDTTHDYIRKCQALWYVVDVKRVCDDPVLEEIMSDYGERFRDAFAIVITKIDLGIEEELAKRMRKKGQSVGDYYEAKEQIDRLQGRLKEIRRLIKTASAAEKSDLRDERDDLTELLDAEETKRVDCLVDARNTSIEIRLRRDKQKHLPEGAVLALYFVSNPQYDMHVQREDERTSSPRFGHIRDTGIPGLREYALILAAPGVWDAYTHHLMFKMKVLFGGVHGWAQDSPTKRQAGLMDAVNSTSNLWTAAEDLAINKMIGEFDSGIIQTLRLANTRSYQGVWKHFEAITRSPWWPSSFLAFFRNDGKHWTKAIGNESWNERFISSQTREALNPAWNEQLPQPDKYFDEPINKLTRAIEDLPETLNRMPGSVPLPIGAFKVVLDAEVFGVEAAHRRHKQRYTQSLANIKLDATLDQHTGHFTQAMQPCYDDGQDDRGEGVCTRHKNRLHSHFTKNDLIGQATDKLAVALKDNVCNHARALNDDPNGIFADITRQFEIILKRDAETWQEKRARLEIFNFLVGAMPSVHRIENELNTIRQRYS